MLRESPTISPPVVEDYAIKPDIDGTIVCRTQSTGEQGSFYSVLCCCGSRSGPYVTVEMASLIRERHEAQCLWPRR